MKNIVYFIAVSFFISPFLVFAQPTEIKDFDSSEVSLEYISQEELEDFLSSGNSEETVLPQNKIYITDLRTELDQYNPGDVVQGQFLIHNLGEESVADIYYITDSETKEGPIVLEANSKRYIFFTQNTSRIKS